MALEHSSLNFIPKASLLLLAIGLLIFLPMSWLGFYLPKAIFIAFGLSVFFFFLTFKKEKINLKKSPFFAVLGYFFLLLIFTIFSQSPLSSFLGISASMQGFQTHLLFLGAFILAISLEKHNLSHLFKVLTGIHVTVGCYALLQWLRLDPLIFFWNNDYFLHRTFSFLGNPNWLGAFIVLTLPVLFLQYQSVTFTKKVKENSGLKKMWLILVFEWLVLFSTGSKIAFLGGGIITGLILWKTGVIKSRIATKGRKTMVKITVLGVLGILGVFISLKLLYPNTYLLFRSWDVRQIIWSDTFKILARNFWGHGLDIFGFYYPQVASPDLWQFEAISATTDTPHNQILLLLFESGILGLLLFYGTVFYIVYQHFKKTEPYFLFAGGIVAYLVTNLFGFETIVNGFIFWLLLGVLVRSNGGVKGSVDANKKLYFHYYHRVIFGIFGLIFLSLGSFNYLHLVANITYEKGWQNILQRNADQGIPQLEETIKKFPYDRVFLLQASEALLALKNASPKQLENVHRYLEQVQQLGNGLDSEVPILLSWLYAKEQKGHESEEYFEKAIEQYPLKLRNYLIGFEIFTTLKKPEKIKELKNSLLEVLPSHWNKPETESGRIFQKNYPWITSMLSDLPAKPLPQISL